MIYVLGVRTVRTHIYFSILGIHFTNVYTCIYVTLQYNMFIYVLYVFYTTARGKLIMLFSSTVSGTKDKKENRYEL